VPLVRSSRRCACSLSPAWVLNLTSLAPAIEKWLLTANKELSMLPKSKAMRFLFDPCGRFGYWPPRAANYPICCNPRSRDGNDACRPLDKRKGFRLQPSIIGPRCGPPYVRGAYANSTDHWRFTDGRPSLSPGQTLSCPHGTPYAGELSKAALASAQVAPSNFRCLAHMHAAAQIPAALSWSNSVAVWATLIRPRG
jgi:hypothetical protein